MNSISHKIKCPVCGVEVHEDEASKHHVVPKSKGGTDTVRICNTCHKQLHALFTNKELMQIETIEGLKEYDSVQKYINWRKKRGFSGKLKTKKSKRVKKQGRYK